MTDLFAKRREDALRGVEPLAVRMRPRTLDEFIGQRHILGDPSNSDGSNQPLLRRMLSARRLTSILLHGPPGTGKTTLARVIANHIDAAFIPENAAQAGVARIREAIADARRRLEDNGRRTILFLDEIHRFSKAQQDVLLEDVERGILILIGATTENPLFAVNSALVSRSTLFRLEPLTPDDIRAVLRAALTDPERGLGTLKVTLHDDALDHWAAMADGDARRALNALETAVLSSRITPSQRTPGDAPDVPDRPPDGPLDGPGADGVGQGPQAAQGRAEAAPGREQGRPPGQPAPAIVIDLAIAQESIQRKAIVYDRDGDQHYDHASAIIKSIRGSDPDAALYWLAVMIEAGEDPRFIARRLAILASEDIGNADPRAILIADATWSLVERIGMPEARITLAQCATYLALAPKSNASYIALDAALADVRNNTTAPVPLHIRDKTKPRSEGSPDEGKGYQYSHNAPTQTSLGGITGQDYLTVDKRYYEPGNKGFDKILADRLAEVREARERARGGQ
ncbi:MAG: replication-associated recombination protein A [Phycisphaerales bacterium]